MNNLAFLRKIVFTLFAVLIAAFSWGQVTSSSLSGSGTEGSPYQITSPTDWNNFASDVNGGYSYSGEYVKLMANIEVACTTAANMVGTAEYSFKGTFDGDNKTLTFNYDYTQLPSADRLDYVAPFRYINGATIKNLNVAGEIKMNKNNAGGLFCVNDIDEDSKSNITGCTVSVNIIGYKDYCGGFAHDAKNANFTGCVYNGQLQIGRYSGGFSAKGNNKTNITNCLCAPAAESEIYSGSAVFVKNNHAIVSADSYWTLEPSHNPNPSITTQGTRAYTTEPAVFTKKQQLIDGNYYYVEGNATITGLNDAYTYTGNPITVSYGLTFAGAALTEGTDFTAVISPATVQEKQTYTLTLTGKGDYRGTITKAFDVIEGLTGDGTAESPYLIYSPSDWEIFTEDINAGANVDKYYKLKNDITIGSAGAPINTIVGVDGHPFSGHFDGDFHTLEIYINRTENYAAPFGVIYGATIENLAVEGTVTSTKKYLAGIAAIANYNVSEARTNNITNCISRVDIYCNTTENSGDCSTGGLIGQNETGIMNFTNCIFDGTINGNSSGTTQKCGGFVNYNGSKINYNHCAMAGQIINVSSNKATFNRGTNGTFVNDTVSYFCIDYGGVTVSAKVRQATTDVEGLGICGKYTLDATTYYVPGGVITGGVETTTYAYTGDTISTDPFVITYYGWTLTEGTDYDIVLTYSTTEEGSYKPVSVIQEAGYYKINITGKGNYGGTYTCPTIHVIDISTWLGLKTALAERNANITLTQNYSDDNNEGALEVSGTIVLDLNGHTLNRNRASAETDGCVIKVKSTGNLTINNSGATDAGIITGGYNDPHGGGIYNEGILTLNNVVVKNNTSAQLGGGIYSTKRFYMNGGAIKNNTAIGNSSYSGGGGVYAEGGATGAAFKLNDVAVTGNVSQRSKGGGIRLKMQTRSDSIAINRCVITNNVIWSDNESKGGGIYYDSNTSDPRKLTITDSEICANTATRDGGGIYALKGTVELNNCTLAENSARIGGGVCINSGLIVNGGEIFENTSLNEGGGVYMYSGKTMQIKGDAQIIGNTSTNTVAENVYLAGSTDVIEVIGDISGANIGVSRSATGAITSGLSSYGTEKNFTADNSQQRVILYGGEAYLQNYYIWGVTAGWPDLEGIVVDGNNYGITAVVDIPNGTTIAPPTTITLTGPSMLIVEDGGQLVSNTALTPVVVKKNIEAAPDAGDDTYGWYTIASPVNAPSITSATSLITGGDDPTFDLLRYDEPTHYWESYNDNTAGHGDFVVLENGRGYMYRNAGDVTVEFEGTINSTAVDYAVSCAGERLTGFNLIGNPFTHNIKLANISLSAGTFTGGYILNKAGEWSAEIGTNDITPCQGVLIQVSADATATISPTAGSKSRATEEYVQFTVANSKYEDVAYAMFDEGAGLNKIEHMNKDIPMVYIHQNDEDYAIATMEKERKSFNLNFVAKTTGRYTLSVKPEGDIRYLHIIDCLTGKDIDMLKEKEYSFVASITDSDSRFIVLLDDKANTDNDVFAYQNGNTIVVSGEGELQVFDVMGRMVATQYINGVGTWYAASVQTGVYILKLDNKIQKIIVK